MLNSSCSHSKTYVACCLDNNDSTLIQAVYNTLNLRTMSARVFAFHNFVEIRPPSTLMPLLSTLPNEPYNIFFEMAPYIEICHAYSGRGGVPAKKFGLFVTAGGQTCGKVCRSIACPYSTSLCPYCQETKEQHSEMFRFGPQPTPCTVVVFGMFSGQRSTQGKGPSGEPRVLAERLPLETFTQQAAFQRWCFHSVCNARANFGS